MCFRYRGQRRLGQDDIEVKTAGLRGSCADILGDRVFQAENRKPKGMGLRVPRRLVCLEQRERGEQWR